MAEIKLPLPPVGVKIITEKTAMIDDVPTFRGISYCLAVTEVTNQGECWVDAQSIDTCGWAPFVLGFATPSTEFEKSLLPRLPKSIAGLYLANLDSVRKGIDPDVVLVRTTRENLHLMLDKIGWENAAWEYAEEKRLSVSSLSILREQKESWRSRLLQPVNRSLAAMNSVPGWKQLTSVVFKSRYATQAFDSLIKRTMADMSMCRNSTVIPYLTGKVNTSFFCTGGISWGGNDPQHMTSGWPWEMWGKIKDDLSW